MGRTKKQHNTKPAMDVPAPAAPATPILTAPAVSDALPVAPEKGYLRATIESETVEKTVSYLSGYAPTLMGLYDNLKERLPETVKGHVNALETDYVIPYTKQGLVVANDTVDKVDEFVSKTEAQVRTSVTTTTDSLRTNVTSTTEAVHATVAPYQAALEGRIQATKTTVAAVVTPLQEQALGKKEELVSAARPYVDTAIKTTTGLVYTTVGTGLDVIDSAVDYVLPASEEDEVEVEPVEENDTARLQARVAKLSAKLVTRLERLSLVAAIHKSKATALDYAEQTRATTSEFVQAKYTDVDATYVQPSRTYLLAKYKETLAAKTDIMQKLNDTVIVPTAAFVEGFKKESWRSEVVTTITNNLPKSREELRLKLVEGYNMLQANVLHPAADYAGVAETFKAYEELIISKVVASVQVSTLDNAPVELIDPDADMGPETWHDAPTKVDFDKMVPLYPTDESPMK